VLVNLIELAGGGRRPMVDDRMRSWRRRTGRALAPGTTMTAVVAMGALLLAGTAEAAVLPPSGKVPLAGLYPGDGYVDRTGLDSYNLGTTAASGWQSFEQIFGPSIGQFRALSAKPLMLAEVGSAEQGGNKPAWITDFFARLAARPQVRAFTWFNHDKEADWRAQSSDASRLSFARGVAATRYIG
jgi:hypothetical protein